MKQTTLPRPVSAADVRPGDYPRARFDEGIKDNIRNLAEKRAPDKGSQLRHEVGIAGEYAVSGYCRIPVNKESYGDFSGDPGWDLSMEKRGEHIRIEVKSVHNGNLKLRVSQSELETADYFVLCDVSPALDVVDIVGGIRANDLAQVGRGSPYDSTIRADPIDLEILVPRTVLPDDIREAQQSE